MSQNELCTGVKRGAKFPACFEFPAEMFIYVFVSDCTFICSFLENRLTFERLERTMNFLTLEATPTPVLVFLSPKVAFLVLLSRLANLKVFWTWDQIF